MDSKRVVGAQMYAAEAVLKPQAPEHGQLRDNLVASYSGSQGQLLFPSSLPPNGSEPNFYDHKYPELLPPDMQGGLGHSQPGHNPNFTHKSSYEIKCPLPDIAAFHTNHSVVSNYTNAGFQASPNGWDKQIAIAPRALNFHQSSSQSSASPASHPSGKRRRDQTLQGQAIRSNSASQSPSDRKRKKQKGNNGRAHMAKDYTKEAPYLYALVARKLKGPKQRDGRKKVVWVCMPLAEKPSDAEYAESNGNKRQEEVKKIRFLSPEEFNAKMIAIYAENMIPWLERSILIKDVRLTSADKLEFGLKVKGDELCWIPEDSERLEFKKDRWYPGCSKEDKKADNTAENLGHNAIAKFSADSEESEPNDILLNHVSQQVPQPSVHGTHSPSIEIPPNSNFIAQAKESQNCSWNHSAGSFAQGFGNVEQLEDAGGVAEEDLGFNYEDFLY